ncbi:MAG: fimbrial biogenesis chaperone [Thermoanaerobaculia bacterium]
MRFRLSALSLVLSLGASPSLAAPQAPPAAPSPMPALPGSGGAGDLLVAPTRVILEGSKRSAELTLLNVGAKPATYRISFLEMEMTPDGELKEVAAPPPGKMVSSKLIRYAPREVLLEPGVSQTIRLQVRKPSDLATGEYRSHLLLRAVPAAEEPQPEGEGEERTFQIRLIPVFGVTIPIIVRHGPVEARASLSGLEVTQGTDGSAAARVTIGRAGSASLYGNLTVRYTPPGGTESVVGEVNGVGVYAEIPERRLTVSLRPPPGVTVGAGTLRAVYREAVEDGKLLAETTRDLR